MAGARRGSVCAMLRNVRIGGLLLIFDIECRGYARPDRAKNTCRYVEIAGFCGWIAGAPLGANPPNSGGASPRT